MNEVQVFPSKEFGDIRTMMIDGHEYFCGNDVATALCYQKPKDAISRHCKGATFQRPLGEQQKMKYIPLGDVYRLIVKASSQSNNEEIKEKAGRFESLVFDEILPQIHKTGSYGTPQTLQQQIQTIAKGTDELYQRVDAVTEEVQTVRSELKNLKDGMPVFQTDAKDIQNALRKKAIETLGGKDSNAYRDKSIHGYTFVDIQMELRRQFGVKRYDQIKHKDVPDALKVIEEYKPPIHIRDKIAMANAQQRLDV